MRLGLSVTFLLNTESGVYMYPWLRGIEYFVRCMFWSVVFFRFSFSYRKCRVLLALLARVLITAYW